MKSGYVERNRRLETSGERRLTVLLRYVKDDYRAKVESELGFKLRVGIGYTKEGQGRSEREKSLLGKEWTAKKKPG